VTDTPLMNKLYIADCQQAPQPM